MLQFAERDTLIFFYDLSPSPSSSKHHLPAMDIASLLNPDHRPAMDIAHLLTDDSDQSDHIVNSPATPSQRPVTPQPPLQISLTAARPPQGSATPTPPPEKPVTTAAVTLPQESATPAPPLKRPTVRPQSSAKTPVSPPERSLTPVLPSQRAVARARPKRPRKPTVASLNAQREAFEFVVKHLPYVLRDLDDDSSSTSLANSTDSEEDDPTIAGDHDAQRMRSFLKRTVVLSRQAQEEIAKRTEYLRLLKRHYESTANLHKLMRGLRLDYWFWMCERWREITRQYYQPLSEDRCYEIVQETLQAIEAHTFPKGMKKSDAFGWRDWFQLDADQHYVRVMTRKTLENTDVKQIVDHSWSLYTDGDSFKTAHLGDKCEFFLQVLQQISPDIVIIQRVEKYPDLVQLTHSLAIAFRLKTDTGYMIVFRCIESPQLQMLMKADGLSMSGSFFWETFDIAHRDEQGECDAVGFTLAGSIGSDNPTYARRWRNELVIALVRYEIEFMDTPILPIESSSEENAISDSQAPPP